MALSVPWFSADHEPTPAGAREAAAQLDAFAAGHRVSATLRHALEAFAINVVEALGGEGGPVTLEADIDQGNVQVAITQKGTVAEAWIRLPLAG
jgi:hypothetical protein